jgi:ABC-type cobalamin/Fe3+-siderophores transport system ATPase subunit
VIEATDLSFAYSSGFSISCSEFRAPKGAITCLIGNNGSGKTTLLQLIGGKLTPTAGTIQLNGRALCEYDKSEAEKCIGWIDVSTAELLVEHMSIRDHLALALLIAKKPVPFFYNKLKSEGIVANRLMKLPLLNSTENLEKKIWQLSAGQKQLIAILLGIIGEKKVVLCDESTAHLDYSNAKLFFEEITKIAEILNSAFIVITHDLLLAAEYGNYHYIFSNGSVNQIEFKNTMDTSERIVVLKEMLIHKA